MTMVQARPEAGTAALAPNWFAAVMGTGIVATSAATLPVPVPGVRGVATVVWSAAAALLVVLVVRLATDLAARRGAHLDDPVVAQFWGAPPMALMTVGAGTLLFGRDVVGSTAAVVLATGLWLVGTVLGLVTAVVIPYLTATRHRGAAVFAGRLMPVVPPMVSASTGALLVPYLPVGLRADVLGFCWAMFGISVVATLVVLPQLWRRLRRHGAGPARLVPTWFIVLGPLGQSVTAAHLLGGATGHPVFALLYGVPVLGVALVWLVVAAALMVRAARDGGVPFAMTWWSFTFPVGTVVTGAGDLAARTGSVALAVLATVLFGVLVAMWTVVAARTVRSVID
jgi:tellurite resistance protein TehA-like permease